MSHADEGTLHAYLDGELTAVEAAGLEQHLAACAPCRARLEEARALIERAHGLLALASPPADATAPRRPPAASGSRLARPLPRWLPLAWAASVLLALGGGWFAHGGLDRALDPDLAPLLEQDTQAQPMPTDAAPPPATSQPANRVAAPAAKTEVGRVAASGGRGAEPETKATREEAAMPSAPAEVPAVADAVIPAAPTAQRRSVQQAAAEGAAVSGLAANAAVESLDRDAALSRLGGEAYVIADVPVRVIGLGADGVLVVEHELEPGVVVRLIERRATADETRQYADDQRVAARARQDASERLARYIGALRVEIEGPVPVDSLSRLLEKLTPLR